MESSEVHGQRGGDQAGPLPSTDSRHGILGPGTAAKHIPSPSGWPRVPAQRLGPSGTEIPRAPPTPPSRKARNTSPTPERKNRKGRGFPPTMLFYDWKDPLSGERGGNGLYHWPLRPRETPQCGARAKCPMIGRGAGLQEERGRSGLGSPPCLCVVRPVLPPGRLFSRPVVYSPLSFPGSGACGLL